MRDKYIIFYYLLLFYILLITFFLKPFINCRNKSLYLFKFHLYYLYLKFLLFKILNKSSLKLPFLFF